uniref:Plastid division protein PDV2 n=1 Tax=Kalanchoe fedtschenkoi TaxID=63787 RepID=A0A7N0TE66_KALFE
MDDEGIGIVLAKATELRSKINNCIDKASSTPRSPRINGGAAKLLVNGKDPDPDEEELQEAESLMSIRDALESLESQLASLQELQQQQRYERESALAEIDYSRKMLLNKLKDYKGKDLEVIHEASAFASESVEHSNDLLLPPYPTRLPRPLVLENGYASHFTLDKSARNGVLSNGLTSEAKRQENETRPGARSSWRGLRILFGSAAKMVLTVVGVVSILNMAGFEPRIKRRGSQAKFLSFFALPAPEILERRAVPILRRRPPQSLQRVGDTCLFELAATYEYRVSIMMAAKFQYLTSDSILLPSVVLEFKYPLCSGL